MFKIVKENFGKFSKIKLVNLKTGEYVSIIPEFGANINEIVLMKKKKLFRLLDGDKNYSDLLENKWFKGAKLIPFPNRINGAEYGFNGKNYNLEINFSSQNHAIHGLIYNKNLKVIEENYNQANASIKLEYECKGLVGYPFKFLLNIIYTLDKKGFECETIIRNSDKNEIPFGDGWHPYFTLGTKVGDLYLKIPSSEKIIINELSIPTGERLIFKDFIKLRKIDKIKLDTGFFIKKNKDIAKTEIFDKKSNLKIVIWQETGKNKYNYLQVFIPPKRDSIAIEPMTCNTNAFNNKEGLIILKPNKTFRAKYGVRLI